MLPLIPNPRARRLFLQLGASQYHLINTWLTSRDITGQYLYTPTNITNSM